MTGASLDVAVEASQLMDAVNLHDVGTRFPGERDMSNEEKKEQRKGRPKSFNVKR